MRLDVGKQRRVVAPALVTALERRLEVGLHHAVLAAAWCHAAIGRQAWAYGNADAEGGALSYVARHLDLAAVKLDELFDERQPQACAFGLGGAIELPEALE